MPNDNAVFDIDTLVNAGDSAATATTDTVVAAPKEHRAQYLGGFPRHEGNDTSFQHINQMPVLEVSDAGNARTHNSSPLHDTGSMIMFLLSCLFLITSYRLGNVYISNLMHNMFSTKGKDDLYADHTMSDTRIIVALIINTCLMEGLLLFYGLAWIDPQLTLALQRSVFLHVFVLVMAAGLFITLQLFLYRLIGFTFSDDRLTVALYANNPFRKNVHIRTRITQGDITGWSDNVNAQMGRMLNLTLSYRFGKLKASVKKTEITIENSDEVGGIKKGR